MQTTRLRDAPTDSRTAVGTSTAESRRPTLEHEAFHGFPYGLIVIDRDGSAISINSAANRLVEAAGIERRHLTCCRLLGCGAQESVLADACVMRLAFDRGEPLPEIRVDIVLPDRLEAVWVTAAPLAHDQSKVIIQLRPGAASDRRRRTEPHWIAGPRLQIKTLGRTTVESGEGLIGGSWLDQRPGQLLKYLVAERHRSVHPDEIGESIWPGSDFGIGSSVRYYIHALRRKLEPERGKREQSSFVISGAGYYRLDLSRIRIDADEFERQVSKGLASAQSAPATAVDELERGLALYHGDFLADTPYADWAMLERHRLHDLACVALRSLTSLRLDRGLLEDAVRSLEQLAGLQPYDEEVNRQLLELYVQGGRHSEAVRRYAALRVRIRRTFGHDPTFALADLVQAE